MNPTSSLQIGLRGHPRTADWLQPSYDYGYNIITMKEFRSKGLTEVVKNLQNIMGSDL